MKYQKPMIHIAVYNPDHQMLKEIIAGIEEEGVLYEISYSQDKDVNNLGYRAVQNSLLGAGIGMKRDAAIFQCSPMKKDQSLFQIDSKAKEDFRLLGSNAARYVKKIPFKVR